MSSSQVHASACVLAGQPMAARDGLFQQTATVTTPNMGERGAISIAELTFDSGGPGTRGREVLVRAGGGGGGGARGREGKVWPEMRAGETVLELSQGRMSRAPGVRDGGWEWARLRERRAERVSQGGSEGLDPSSL
eukprot:1893464-Rhodomonas_salina.1